MTKHDLFTVAHICHGKTYFSTAKLAFPRQNLLFHGKTYFSRQNLLFHGKTYFSTAKLTFPRQNFIKGLGGNMFVKRKQDGDGV